ARSHPTPTTGRSTGTRKRRRKQRTPNPPWRESAGGSNAFCSAYESSAECTAEATTIADAAGEIPRFPQECESWVDQWPDPSRMPGSGARASAHSTSAPMPPSPGADTPAESTHELVTRARLGDESAWTELVARYEGPLRRSVRGRLPRAA